MVTYSFLRLFMFIIPEVTSTITKELGLESIERIVQVNSKVIVNPTIRCVCVSDCQNASVGAPDIVMQGCDFDSDAWNSG